MLIIMLLWEQVTSYSALWWNQRWFRTLFWISIWLMVSEIYRSARPAG